MEQNIDILKNISKVEPSEFLFNKIQLKIEMQKKNEIPLPKMYAIAASILLIISLNIIAMTWKNTQNNIQNTISINTQNNFYNE